MEETAYENLEFEARCIIDYWTFNRLHKETEYPEPVKRCMYSLIGLLKVRQDAITVHSKDENGVLKAGLTSESNDGVSASYNTLSAKEAIDVTNSTVKRYIKSYLYGVRDSLGHRLLYRGVYPDE